ncbi:MAG: aminotransferase class I/II-fold pyridoxal phosphate-dependent enzyme [Firmicutes bacterium]|nr:aminotransferase class I/II-fold pyridoxal phosphate-dependent enzyme [Bacillota bacterium]
MKTPILDFAKTYDEKAPLRLHVPGHKGKGPLGSEGIDLTEIDGADSLYDAEGIIRESEKNAGSLFGAETFFSAEGSSLCIRAMLYLAVLYARSQGKKPVIAAGRNAHKTFLSGAALLDFELLWLYPKKMDSYLSCLIDSETLEEFLVSAEEKPTAVYLTSPDYLGNTLDLAAISEVCHRHDVLLIVDNAHGAYLKFLPQSRHPMDLGADLCCDSAHKTLPSVTGGAYLHVSKKAPELFREQAKNALALFGSTSPSYLIMESLDGVNAYLDAGYREKLERFIPKLDGLKSRLMEKGWTLLGDEPLKLTLVTKPFGYEGQKLAKILEDANIVCEFADPDFLVMMFTPEITAAEMQKLEAVLMAIPRKEAIEETAPAFVAPQRVLSVREALFSPSEVIPVSESLGRTLAAATVGCPPAVPIVVCGEKIKEEDIKAFLYYGIETCSVVKEVR